MAHLEHGAHDAFDKLPLSTTCQLQHGRVCSGQAAKAIAAALAVGLAMQDKELELDLRMQLFLCQAARLHTESSWEEVSCLLLI
jgi:hypothetical protein